MVSRCVIPYSSDTFCTASQLNSLPQSDYRNFVTCPAVFTSVRNFCRQTFTTLVWWWTHVDISINHIRSRRNSGHRPVMFLSLVHTQTSPLICSPTTFGWLFLVPKFLPCAFCKAQPSQSSLFASTLIRSCLSTFITWSLFWWQRRSCYTCNAFVARWASAACRGIHTRIANTCT